MESSVTFIRKHYKCDNVRRKIDKVHDLKYESNLKCPSTEGKAGSFVIKQPKLDSRGWGAGIGNRKTLIMPKSNW